MSPTGLSTYGSTKDIYVGISCNPIRIRRYSVEGKLFNTAVNATDEVVVAANDIIVLYSCSVCYGDRKTNKYMCFELFLSYLFSLCSCLPPSDEGLPGLRGARGC